MFWIMFMPAPKLLFLIPFLSPDVGFLVGKTSKMPYLVLQIHYGDIKVFRGESSRLHGPTSTLTGRNVTCFVLLGRSAQRLLRTHRNDDLQPVSIPVSVCGLQHQQGFSRKAGCCGGGGLVGL